MIKKMSLIFPVLLIFLCTVFYDCTSRNTVRSNGGEALIPVSLFIQKTAKAGQNIAMYVMKINQDGKNTSFDNFDFQNGYFFRNDKGPFAYLISDVKPFDDPQVGHGFLLAFRLNTEIPGSTISEGVFHLETEPRENWLTATMRQPV